MRALKIGIIILLSAVILINANLVMATGKPTIKTFKVDYLRQGDNLTVKVITDLPNNTHLSIICEKAGLKDNDRWIGCKDQFMNVQNGKAEATLSIGDLPKGQYIVEITWNSLWLSQGHKDPQVQSIVGEYGENIKTPYVTTRIHSGKKYRSINYKKTAFHITDHDVKQKNEYRNKLAAISKESNEASEKQRREHRKIYSDENIKLALFSYAQKKSSSTWQYKIMSVDKINRVNNDMCEAKGILEKLSFDYSKLRQPMSARDTVKFNAVIKLGDDGWVVDKLEQTQVLSSTTKSYAD